jgi:hypothetical protein
MTQGPTSGAFTTVPFGSSPNISQATAVLSSTAIPPMSIATFSAYERPLDVADLAASPRDEGWERGWARRSVYRAERWMAVMMSLGGSGRAKR